MRQKKTKKNRQKTTPEQQKLTFREHIQELRKRVIYVAFSIGIWSIVTYIFERQTINALLRPAKHQQFIYTSPIGGIDFMFRVSLYIALILSLPVIVYNSLAFLSPLLSRSSRLFISVGAIASGLLAACGLAFGYFVGLPSAMHFLLHQFITSQIRPLLTVQSYLSFVMVYMLGSALMLQIPLILIFINRIKPLKPSQLLRYERWVIAGSFVMSAIMDPTPNVVDLLIVASPLILMYQVGIIIIAFINKSQKNKTYETDVPESVNEAFAQPMPQRQTAILRQFADIQRASRAPKPLVSNVVRPKAPIQKSMQRTPKYFDIIAGHPIDYIGKPFIQNKKSFNVNKMLKDEAAS